MAAKKPKSYELYATQYKQKYENALTQAKAIAEQEMQDSGTQFDDAQIVNIAQQIARTGSFDLAMPSAAAPVIPEVKAPAPSGLDAALSDIKTEGETQGYFGGLADSLQASAQRTVGSALKSVPKLLTGSGVADAQDSTEADGLQKLLLQVSSAGKLVVADQLAKATGGAASEWLRRAEANSAAGKIQQDKAADSNWVMRQLKEGGIDAAESGASGAASLVGGPAGVVPIADVFSQEYLKATEAGLSDEQAKQWAATQAAPEAVSFIPARRALEFIPGVSKLAIKPLQRAIAGAATKRLSPAIVAAMKVAKTGVGEGAEETVSGSLQDIASMAIAGSEQGALSDYAEKQAPKSLEEFAGNRWKDFRAGAIMGGTLGAKHGVQEAYAEDAAIQDADLEAVTGAASTNFDRASGEYNSSLDKQIVEAAQERNRRTEAEAVNAEKALAFDEAEQARAADEETKRVEMEAGFQTMERDANLPTSRVERYGTSNLPEETLGTNQVVERVPVNPAAAITPEQVIQQETAVKEEAAATQDRSELGQLAEQIRKEQESIAKAKAKADAKKTSVEKAAERVRQRDIARSLIAENPGTTHEELAPLLRERLAQPEVVESDVSPVEKRVTSIRSRMSAAAKAKQTKADNDRLKRLVINNPEATDADIAAMFEGNTVAPAPIETATPEVPVQEAVVATTPEPVKKDKDLNDVEVDSLADSMGLGTLNMDATQVAEEHPDFKGKVRSIFRDMIKRNTQEGVDIQNLVRQGKIIMAPNAESIGRSDTGVASYDNATGKMYMYTDHIADSNSLPAVIAGLHESVHAGQSNKREGRESLLESIMGKERFDKAQALVRAEARKGNKIAKAAVEKAEAAAKSNPDYNGDVESLEVMPYFAGEIAAHRGSAGTVSKVARDVVDATRTALRDKLGLDLDVNINDIAAATQKAAGEIVKTDLAPTGDGSLDMVVRGSATNDPRQRYKGAIDGLERYVLSDAAAEVMSEYIHNLQRGQMVPLGDLLQHPKLFELYPQLKEVRVVLDDDQVGYGAGVFNPNTGEIGLSEESVANLDSEDIRNTVLHETQHAVQAIEGFIGGENWNRLMAPHYDADMDKARKSREKVVSQFELGRWKQTTTPTRLREFENTVAEKGIQNSPYDQSLLVLQNGWNKDSTDRIVQRYDDLKYKPSRDSLNQAIRAANNERARAMDLYYRNYGEAEARTTEYASRMSQKELDNLSFEEIFPDAYKGVKVEDTLDTGGYGKGRRPDQTSASAGTTLDMMSFDELTKKYKETRIVPSVITGLFRGDQGVGREINAMVEAAKASPVGKYMIAEDAVGRYKQELKKQAATSGKTYAQLNAAVEADLSGLTSQGTWSANKAAFNAVADKYGAAGKAMKDLRDQIDDMSIEMARQRSANGSPLTNEEKARYKALLANLGFYTHRQYAAMLGETGDSYSSKVWEDYETYKKGKRTTDPVVAKNYAKVAKATKYLIDDSLMIPDDAALASMGQEQLERLHSTWKGESAGYEADDMRAALSATRTLLTPERLQNEADSIAKELLGLTEAASPTSNYYRGAKLDKGILQERKHMPAEISELLGEIKDPSMKMLLTVTKQAEFVARSKLLLDLRNQVGIDLQPPDATGTEAVKGMTRLSGDLYGALAGYYASPNMKALIGDVLQTVTTFEQAVAISAVRPSTLTDKAVSTALGKWGQVAGYTKALQIVWNPANFLYNYAGAYASMLGNGNINPVNVVKGHKAMQELVTYAFNPTAVGKEAIRMNSMGITDSAFIGDIKNGQYKSLDRLVKDMSGEKHMGTALAKAVKYKEGITEIYAMMDVWGKIANFYQQVDVLTDFYKKEGITKTAEEIDREAADITNRTNITYKRAAPLIRAVEKAGATQFGTYFYEVFRSQVGNAAQGIEEIVRGSRATNPAAKAAMILQGGRRLAGQAATWGLAASVSSMLSAATFGDDDEEAEQKRKLLPEYLRDQDFIELGKDDKGMPVLFNVSRVDPIGPATDFMRMAMNGEVDGDEIRKKLVELYIAPRLLGQVYAAGAAAIADTKVTRQPSIQQWSPTAYGEVARAGNLFGMDANTTKGIVNLLETFSMPGVTNALRDTNGKVAEGQPEEALASMLRFSGVQLAKLDPSKAAMGASIEYSQTLKTMQNDVADLFKDTPDTTEAEALDKVLSLASKERKAFREVRDTYRGLLAFDVSKADATAIFKEQRLSAETIRSIANDSYTSQVINKRTIDSYATKEMKGKTLEQQREVKQKWENVWEILSQVDSKIKEKK